MTAGNMIFTATPKTRVGLPAQPPTAAPQGHLIQGGNKGQVRSNSEK